MTNTITSLSNDSSIAAQWVDYIFTPSGNLQQDTTITITGCTFSSDFYSGQRTTAGLSATGKTLAEAISATTSLTFGSSNSLSSGVGSTSGVFYNAAPSPATFDALTTLDLSGLGIGMGTYTFQFVQFPALTSINWGTNNLQTLSIGTFYNATFGALTSLDFSGSGITVIGESAFDSTTFTNLTSLNLGSGVTVGSLAFGSAKLNQVQQLIIGTGTTVNSSSNPTFFGTQFDSLQCVMNGNTTQTVDLSQIDPSSPPPIQAQLNALFPSGFVPFSQCVGNCAPAYAQSTYTFAQNSSATVPGPTGSVGTFCGTSGAPAASISYAITSGTLPAGLTLDTNTGAITGTPTDAAGQYNVTITITTT
jgi:hypothetical protein